jgi:hypothetical protein
MSPLEHIDELFPARKARAREMNEKAGKFRALAKDSLHGAV